MNFNFDWDISKALSNYSKHRVSFTQAAEIFRDPLALSIFDADHSQSEDRWITIGRTGSESMVVVVHTFSEIDKDNVLIRIISARRPTKQEKQQYLEF